MLSGYMESARNGQTPWGGAQPVRELRDRIDEFLGNLESRNPGQGVERRNAALSRQKLIAWLEDQFESLAATLREMPDDQRLSDLRTALIEGTDAAFLVFLDSLETGGEGDLTLAEQMMGDRRRLMQGLRVRYMEADLETRDGGGHLEILESTNSVENIFFLLAQLIREYRTGEG